MADDEDGGGGRGTADTLDDAAEHLGVTLFGPVAIACLVGAVGENNEGRVGFEHQGLLEGFVPAEEERGFGSVDTGSFVGDSRGVLGGKPEEPDGGFVGSEGLRSGAGRARRAW